MDSSIEAERAHQPLPHDSGQLRGMEIALDAGIDERVTAATAVLVCSVVTVRPAWTGMSATLWLSAQTRTVAKRGGARSATVATLRRDSSTSGDAGTGRTAPSHDRSGAYYVVEHA